MAGSQGETAFLTSCCSYYGLGQNIVTKCEIYYKMWQLLQNGTKHLYMSLIYRSIITCYISFLTSLCSSALPISFYSNTIIPFVTQVGTKPSYKSC